MAGLIAAPKIREIYWCDFAGDAILPEFRGKHPAVILSYRNTRHGAVTVIPCTSAEQPDNEWAVPLPVAPTAKAGWAICDKITTVSTRRLERANPPLRLTPEQFAPILAAVLRWLPDH